MTTTRVSALVLALCSATPLRVAASTVSYHLSGRVTNVTGADASALRDHGVKKGAVVSIDWTVELTTPIHSDSPTSHTREYWATAPDNGITAFTIKIANWTATGVDPTEPNAIPVNRLIIHDGPPTDPADTLDVSRTCTATDKLVTDDDRTAEIVLNLLAPNGGGSTSVVLGDPTPSAYLESSGYVVGSGGEVDFAIPGSRSGVDPVAKCRASELASAGTLCQGTLKCLATHAKAPARDPLDAKLDACLGKARDKFVGAFDKAAATAANKDVSCGTAEDGAAFADDFDTAEGAVVSVVDAVAPQDPALVSSWYSGGATMCGAAAKDEAKGITKPTTKVALLRENARLRLSAAAAKAVASAEKRGVVFVPEPDVAGFVGSIDHLVDELADQVNGVP